VLGGGYLSGVSVDGGSPVRNSPKPPVKTKGGKS